MFLHVQNPSFTSLWEVGLLQKFVNLVYKKPILDEENKMNHYYVYSIYSKESEATILVMTAK
jgi:hypothetical protein